MLLRATKSDEVKHSHIAYIRPDGTGSTSKSNGHSHDITTQQPEPSAVPGAVKEVSIVLPAGEDQHTHSLEEVVFEQKKQKELDDQSELKACIALYQEAKTLNGDSINRAVKAENYYKGIQWEEEDRTTLKAQSRACLTLNEIKPKVDMLSGHQRQNRTDIGLLPTEKGDATTVDIFEMRIKNICQTNNFDYKETRTFDDMVRVGIGAMQVNIMASNSGIGEVEVTNRYWDTVLFGPHVEMDGSDADYACIVMPIAKAKLQELYPEKSDDVQKDFEIIAENRQIPISRSDHYIHKGKSLDMFEGDITKKEPDLVDIAKKNYKMIEVQRKVYKRTPVIYNAAHDFYLNCDGMSDADFKAATSIDEISKINHVSTSIQVTVFAGNVLLSKEKSLFSQINVVPFYANKIKNDWWGKVHEAIDAQNELNKRHSQMIDIVNKMASYGLGVTPEAFNSVSDHNDFIKNRNNPGFVAKFKPGFKDQIYEFQGVKFPQEVVAASELNSKKIETIMNIHPEMMGGGSSGESGVSIASKQRAGMTGNEYLFDNFSLSKRRIGHLIIEAIQIVDSPEKLLRISENQNNNTMAGNDPVVLYPQLSPEEIMQISVQQGAINPQMVQAAQQGDQRASQDLQKLIQHLSPTIQKMANEKKRTDLLKALENFELSQYDLVVSESAYSPTTRFSNYVILSEMFRGNPNAPMAQLIELNPYLDQKTKDELKGGLQAQAQASQDMEKMKYQTELQKTAIAKQQPGAPQQ